jgi:hypothetical protein
LSKLVLDPFLKSRWSTVSSKGIIAGIHSFTKTFANSIEPLLFYLGDLPETPLSRFGTAFKLNFGGRFFLICTEHQFQDADPTSVVIISERDQKAVTSHRTYFAFPAENGDLEMDLRMFEFTELVQSGALSNLGWWNAEDTVSYGDKYEIMVAAGYPSCDNGIDYQLLDVKLAPRGVFGRGIGPTFGRLHGISLDANLLYDPDGLSGSPVFALVESSGGFTAKFAGIVSNAGRSQINFWPVSELGRLIKYAIHPKQA